MKHWTPLDYCQHEGLDVVIHQCKCEAMQCCSTPEQTIPSNHRSRRALLPLPKGTHRTLHDRSEGQMMLEWPERSNEDEEVQMSLGEVTSPATAPHTCSDESPLCPELLPGFGLRVRVGFLQVHRRGSTQTASPLQQLVLPCQLVRTIIVLPSMWSSSLMDSRTSEPRPTERSRTPPGGS